MKQIAVQWHETAPTGQRAVRRVVSLWLAAIIVLSGALMVRPSVAMDSWPNAHASAAIGHPHDVRLTQDHAAHHSGYGSDRTCHHDDHAATAGSASAAGWPMLADGTCEVPAQAMTGVWAGMPSTRAPASAIVSLASPSPNAPVV
jgi:uncharacterized protein involved in copper resistance